MMKKLVGIVIFSVLGAALPTPASAQCGGMCSRLMKETGEAVFSCYYLANSGYSCMASETRCQLTRCTNALLVTPEGRVVGELACAAAVEARAQHITNAAIRPVHILNAITRRVRLAGVESRPVVNELHATGS